MVSFVKFIGILVIATCVFFLLKPDAMKKYIEFWIKGKRVYAASAINFVIGVIFLLTALQCGIPLVVAIFGILALAKGIMLSTGGTKKLKAKLSWFEGKSLTWQRIFLILSIGIGILLIYAA